MKFTCDVRFKFIVLLHIFLCIPLLCQTALSLDPLHLNNKGVEEYDKGNFEEALKFLSEAYELSPDNEYVRKNLCNTLLALANEKAKLYQYNEAISLVDKVIKLDKNNFYAYLQGGAYSLNLGKISTAISYLENAIKLKPGYLDAHELLGEAYYREGDILSARVQWEYVLQIDPTRKELKEKYEKATREELVQKNFRKMYSSSRHFQITYPEDISFSTRSAVVTYLEQAYLEIGRKLGGIFPSSPVQVVLYDTSRFSAVVQLGQTIGGVYDGRIRISVSNKEGIEFSKDEIKRRIYHEYTHVAIFDYLKDRAPWWVNEGLAEFFSTELDSGKKLIVVEAVERKTLMDFCKLEEVKISEFLESQSKISLAYAQSHCAIHLLWRRYGQGKFLSFLRSIKDGLSPETGLQRVYNIDYEKLLKDVIEYASR
ncbi:MAG: tetratricopeptide repeat protein [Candidatus Hydrogenedentes bacterium]|nr:tetratricopeptide repeat protein [Candidatus Hydrogenedentota bacterium]